MNSPAWVVSEFHQQEQGLKIWPAGRFRCNLLITMKRPKKLQGGKTNGSPEDLRLPDSRCSSSDAGQFYPSSQFIDQSNRLLCQICGTSDNLEGPERGLLGSSVTS